MVPSSFKQPIALPHHVLTKSSHFCVGSDLPSSPQPRAKYPPMSKALHPLMITSSCSPTVERLDAHVKRSVTVARQVFLLRGDSDARPVASRLVRTGEGSCGR